MATRLDLAEAQLLGWSNGKHGTVLTSLIEGMGLTLSEWNKIKSQYPSTLTENEKEEIDDYFMKHGKKYKRNDKR